MKKTLLLAALVLSSITAFADNASDTRAVLDKTAAIVGNKGGATANFVLSGDKIQRTSGSLSIKGDKFNAVTSVATIWFDGKTQWTYMSANDEVNISTPTAAQVAQMNPLTFINLYKSGYKLSMVSSGSNYEVHMIADNAQAAIQEVYVTINKTTYIPSQVKLKRKSNWMTIAISNFKTATLSDSVFTFNAKDYPSAEVIDLR